MKTVYVLFGERVCNTFMTEGFLKAVREIVEMQESCSVAIFHQGATSIAEILEVANGWQDYCFIDEQEFDLLNKFI